MKLRDLLPGAAIDARQAAIEIAGVTADSRKVKPGFLFIAIAGAKADGAYFANQAAAAGAVAVAAEQRPDGLSDAVAFVRLNNPRRALALAAAIFFSAPAENDRRHHRHKRENISCGIHPTDMERAWISGGEYRHRRRGVAQGRAIRLVDNT